MSTTLDDHPHPHLDIRWERGDFAGHLAAEAIQCHASPRYRIRPNEVLGVAVCAAAGKAVLDIAEQEALTDAE